MCFPKLARLLFGQADAGMSAWHAHHRQDLPPTLALLGGHMRLEVVVTATPIFEAYVEQLVVVPPGRNQLCKEVHCVVDATTTLHVVVPPSRLREGVCHAVDVTTALHLAGATKGRHAP